MEKKELVVDVKDALKEGIYRFVDDENFRNKVLVDSAKQFLVGYGIGALLSDLIRRK